MRKQFYQCSLVLLVHEYFALGSDHSTQENLRNYSDRNRNKDESDATRKFQHNIGSIYSSTVRRTITVGENPSPLPTRAWPSYHNNTQRVENGKSRVCDQDPLGCKYRRPAGTPTDDVVRRSEPAGR